MLNLEVLSFGSNAAEPSHNKRVAHCNQRHVHSIILQNSSHKNMYSTTLIATKCSGEKYISSSQDFQEVCSCRSHSSSAKIIRPPGIESGTIWFLLEKFSCLIEYPQSSLKTYLRWNAVFAGQTGARKGRRLNPWNASQTCAPLFQWCLASCFKSSDGISWMGALPLPECFLTGQLQSCCVFQRNRFLNESPNVFQMGPASCIYCPCFEMMDKTIICGWGCSEALLIMSYSTSSLLMNCKQN